MIKIDDVNRFFRIALPGYVLFLGLLIIGFLFENNIFNRLVEFLRDEPSGATIFIALFGYPIGILLSELHYFSIYKWVDGGHENRKYVKNLRHLAKKQGIDVSILQARAINEIILAKKENEEINKKIIHTSTEFYRYGTLFVVCVLLIIIYLFNNLEYLDFIFIYLVLMFGVFFFINRYYNLKLLDELQYYFLLVKYKEQYKNLIKNIKEDTQIVEESLK